MILEFVGLMATAMTVADGADGRSKDLKVRVIEDKEGRHGWSERVEIMAM